MKHFIKKFTLLSYFCLATFLYYSCTQEKEYINEKNRINFDLKEKSLKDALDMPIFNNAYSKLTKKKFSSNTSETARTALEDQFGFTIVPEVPVKIITKPDGTVFFTLLIEREVKEELKFENLMIQVKNTETSAAIFKYTMEEKAIKTITNDYIIKEILNSQYTDLNIDGKIFFNGDGDTCFDINVIQCSVPDHRPAGHIATSECWSYFNNVAGASNIYYATSVVCMNDGGIGGGGETGGTGGTSSSTNNTGGLGASGGSSDPVVISPTPCRTANCIEDPITLPCEKLNKLLDTGVGSLNLKPILDSIKPTLSQDGENGNTLRKNQAGLVGAPSIPSTATNGINSPVGPTVFGEIHTHPFQGPYASYPMFSFTDVNRLLDIYNHTGVWNQSDVVSILVVKDDLGVDHVYSLVINDIELFAQKFNEKLNQFPTLMSKVEKLDRIDEELGDKYSNDNNYERVFLEFITDLNISVYKANSTITNWEKLSMSLPSTGGNSVIQTPCN